MKWISGSVYNKILGSLYAFLYIWEYEFQILMIMKDLAKTSVGEIVRTNYKTAQLFEKHGIDFCRDGEMLLEVACKRSKVDFRLLLPEIESLMLISNPESIYLEEMSLDELCMYIVRRHHRYVTDSIPFLQIRISTLCEMHGQSHPELFKVRELFGEAADNLILHMKKEEHILFPRIEKLAKFKTAFSDNATMKPEDIHTPIKQMAGEHQDENERFSIISELTNHYEIPSDACNTYRITYDSLKEFEEDLRKHIYVENNILFRKAIDLEEEFIMEAAHQVAGK